VKIIIDFLVFLTYVSETNIVDIIPII